MSRLPTPGQDNGTWGSILNDYLAQAHNTDGSLKPGSVGAAHIQDGVLPKTKLDTATQASLTKADGSLQAANNLSDVATPATARTNLGLGTAATMTPATLAADTAFSGTYATKKAVALGRIMRGRSVLDAYPNVMASPPAITFSATTGISPNYDYQPDESSRLTILQANTAWNDPSGFQYNTWSIYQEWGVEFDINTGAATAVEVKWRCSSSNSEKFWVWLDGAPTTAWFVAPGALSTTAGSTYYMNIPVSAGQRRIKVLWINASFRGIRAAPGCSVQKTPPPPYRIAVVGDSYIDGGYLSLANSDCIGPHLAALLGGDVALFGTAGSGYVAGSNTFGSATRVSAVQTFNPDAVIIYGSINDDSLAASVQAAATAAFAAYQVALPNVPIYVIGPQQTAANTTLAANRAANTAAVKAAALAAPNVIGWDDPCGGYLASTPAYAGGANYAVGDLVTYQGGVYQCTQTVSNAGGSMNHGSFNRTSWLFGTGYSGATAGDGDRDIAVGTDQIHPSAAGSLILARKIATDFLTTIRGLL
ncbi:MAG TPA: hypothetical protein VIR03_04210 [Candidatus Saccharimonadales bacterium]